MNKMWKLEFEEVNIEIFFIDSLILNLIYFYFYLIIIIKSKFITIDVLFQYY